MKRACKMFNTNTEEQNASSIRPLKINFVRMKIFIFLFTICIFLNSNGFAQPDQWAVAIDPAEIKTLQNSKRSVGVAKVASAISIDGIKDVAWDNIVVNSLNKFTSIYTKYEGGKYVIKSSLDDGDNTRRISSGSEDFSGSFKVLYDEDYLYFFFDIEDDEVNDGVLNPGTNETIEITIAPYPDSADQLLVGKPYPPYSGAGHMGSEGAMLRNLKYCYWGYLGAFQMAFIFENNGTIRPSFRQKADALAKINYEQRQNSCLGSWKFRTDGKNGYYAEIAISNKIALADSANNPLTFSDLVERKIAFSPRIIDRDLGKKDCQASWNTENNNVWDAMLWAGYMNINGSGSDPGNGCDAPKPVANHVNICNSGTVKLTASGGTNYKWYNSLTGSTVISTDSFYNTPYLSNSATYYVTNHNGICETDKVAVKVNFINATYPNITSLKTPRFEKCSSITEKLEGSPIGGEFWGDGVVEGFFIPYLAKANSLNTIYYGFKGTTCERTDSMKVFVFDCEGLEQYTENKAYDIFPNPVEDILYIQSKNESEQIKISLFNNMGEKVLMENEISVSKKEIDVSTLPSGVYHLKISDNSSIVNYSFIKK